MGSFCSSVWWFLCFIRSISIILVARYHEKSKICQIYFVKKKMKYSYLLIIFKNLHFVQISSLSADICIIFKISLLFQLNIWYLQKIFKNHFIFICKRYSFKHYLYFLSDKDIPCQYICYLLSAKNSISFVSYCRLYGLQTALSLDYIIYIWSLYQSQTDCD